MKFKLGHLVATPGALRFLEEHGVNPMTLTSRHCTGDWGDLDPADRAANDRAVEVGLRVFSSYRVGDGKVWIITEADRSSTCILLPDEY